MQAVTQAVRQADGRVTQTARYLLGRPGKYSIRVVLPRAASREVPYRIRGAPRIEPTFCTPEEQRKTVDVLKRYGWWPE